MKRTRRTGRPSASRDTDSLIRAASGLSASGNRLEDAFWEARLSDMTDRLLRAGNEEVIEFALDYLYGADLRAYDELADLIESRAETTTATVEGAEFDVLLIAAPILAWSRFAIPAGTIARDVLANARVQLQAHVFSSGARLSLADFLYSPDQLPHGYAETYRLAHRLGAAAVEGTDLQVDTRRMPKTNRFISDSRYLVGAVAAPRGAPLFRWQEDGCGRVDAESAWRAQGSPCLHSAFTGCAMEVLLPDAYHAACRNADRELRNYSVHAAVAFLQTTLNVAPAGVAAVVAPFHDQNLEEYRIGFTLTDSREVVHGVVWSLLSAEDENSDLPAQIEASLRDAGVSDIRMIDHRFPLEYCDDCGAPLYPTPDGETAHAEMPEHAEAPPDQLH